MDVRNNKLVLTVLMSLVLMNTVGCKTEEQQQAASTSTKGTTTADSTLDSVPEAFCVGEGIYQHCFSITNPPHLSRLNEVPLVLDRTPYINWGPAAYDINKYLPAEGRVVKASDNSAQTAWAPMTMGPTSGYITGLNLVAGEEYYVELRSAHSSGVYSDVVKSANWTARVGSGQWDAISSVNGPSSRSFYSSAWTGQKMIIWGGNLVGTNEITNTGAVYTPSTDTWMTMAMTGAPSPGSFLSVWTGSEMIFWGRTQNVVKTAARYNPTTNTWRSMSMAGPVIWSGGSAIWTGSKMIVWGGQPPEHGSSVTNQGSMYDPVTNTWNTISDVNAPTARQNHVAVWTGSEMLIWGGIQGWDRRPQLTGGFYNPTTNSWRAMNTSGAPTTQNYEFQQHSGYAWTGTQFIMRESIYDLATDSWGVMPAITLPRDEIEAKYLIATGRCAATAWTGSQLFYWGGMSGFGLVNNGGLYDPASGVWTGTSLIDAPSSPFYFPVAFWTGTKVLVWNGTSGSAYTPE